MAKESNWKDFITTSYIQWRQDKRGKDGSAAQFARVIGITPQLLSGWMNKGQVPSDQGNINKLVAIFGYEVYEVLGLRRPDAHDPRTLLLETGFQEEFVDRLLAARSEYSKELSRRGISQDSPEAREIINAAFSRHGIKITDNE